MHPIVKMILKFFVIYSLLTVAYQLYLHHYNDVLNIIDPYTHWISLNVAFLSQWTKPLVEALPYPNSYADMLYMRNLNQFTVLINEGCNGLAINNVFISFVLTFSNGWKKTSIFIFIGLIILYIVNIFRISLINHIRFYYYDWTDFYHDYIFPVIIWGAVVTLWVIWVKNYQSPLINGNQEKL